jgi:Ca-activated chloride channel homolog
VSAVLKKASEVETRNLALLAILSLAVLPARLTGADAGVLLPSGRTQPDPTMLSVEEEAIDIWIDNGDARVLVRQIFSSHWPGVLEGNYLFALPGQAAISDFAVWDGVTRIPGVILERRRAEEIYNNLKRQTIDPGLLQQGERTAEEARRSVVFSARIVPIPAYGTKRVEIEYHESIPVENLTSFFAVPLRPDAYQAQTVGHFWITLELRSEHALRDFAAVSKVYPLRVAEQSPHLVKASFEGRDVTLTEDFALRYALDGSQGVALDVITHRNPSPGAPNPTETAPAPVGKEPGFFEASALLAPPASSGQPAGSPEPVRASPRASRQEAAASSVSGPPRTVVLLFDNSLSMQWEKLERSYRALETLLGTLRPGDRFNVLLFNTEVKSFARAPTLADPAMVRKALEFVRSSTLRGGTDLERALGAALGPEGGGGRQGETGGERYLVLVSDGDATRGTISTGKLADWYEVRRKQLPLGERPRTYVFAVGDDANMTLLKVLARNDGVIEWVRSTEPIEFKLNSFLAKIGRRPVENPRLTAQPESNFDFVYALQDTWFSGSVASWVGQYRMPADRAAFAVSGASDGRPLELRAAVRLPAEELDHPQLPRLWAKARVDALLEKIEREGEDRSSVDEIIRLARKYKFVTPYTSFLAAPRALLRPRVIRPGDPVLRVKTDESIASVVALFPFGSGPGLIKRLRYLREEDTWQTRFLAPADLADGTYLVRLILRDRLGHVYRESKSFVIVSHPPVVRVKLAKRRFRNGEPVRLRVLASEYTRHVVARLPGAEPVELHWNQQAGSNTGELEVPLSLPAGEYALTVTAEDIAHNISTEEVPIEVAP